jgi:hypothetical protein
VIPVEQRELFDAEAGTVGDCWRCCIASILELPYEAVPHFVANEVRGESDSYWNDTQEFLREQRFVLASFALWGTNTPFLRFGIEEPRFHFTAPGHWIAAVKSPRFIEDGEPGSHVVVMNGSSIVYDPHPQRDDGHLGFTDAYLLVST